MIEGRFTSNFKGKPSPLLKSDQKPTATEKSAKETAEQKPVVSGVIDSSPSSARLVLIGSSSFLSDEALGLAAGATGTRYLKPVQLIENVVDWSLEDRGLLALRGRGQFSRMLEPMGRNAEMFWEYLNYGLALAGLALIYGLQRRSRSRRLRHYRDVLNLGRA